METLPQRVLPSVSSFFSLSFQIYKLKAKEKETSILDNNIFNPIANPKHILYNEEHLLWIKIMGWMEIPREVAFLADMRLTVAPVLSTR